MTDFAITYPVTTLPLGSDNGGTYVEVLPETATLMTTPKCAVCGGYLDGAEYGDSCRCGRRPVARVERVRR